MSNFLDDLLDERTANTWIDQNSPEWDAIRLGRFTASELHRLMAPSKREMTDEELKARPKGSKATLTTDYSKLSEAAMTYVTEKVAEVFTGHAKSQGYAFPLVWGQDNEPVAAEYFANKTGLEVSPCGFFTYTDHAGGSPDRLVGDEDILEIKCPFESVNQVKYLQMVDHYDLRNNYFPYWVQCQANLVFTGRRLCHFVTFDSRMISEKHKMAHIIIPADTEFQDLIRAQIALAVKEKLSLIQTLSV
jgi:hypothetical protein